jgi:dolichol-phosphate mannosyltransferase
VGFSNFLLNMTLLGGLIVMALAVAGATFMTVAFLLRVPYPVGIPSLTIIVMFLGGIQLVSVGVLGQYLGRVYDEVRDRPTSIVDRSFNMGPGRAKRGGR